MFIGHTLLLLFYVLTNSLDIAKIFLSRSIFNPFQRQVSISEREQGNPHNKIALFETKCNDMLHLTILQYNTRKNNICFSKKFNVHFEMSWISLIYLYICILIYLIHLNYHPITRWRYFPTWICGNNFSTSRISPFHDFKILDNEILNSQIPPSLFQFLIFDNSLYPIFTLLALSLWIGVLCWH